MNNTNISQSEAEILPFPAVLLSTLFVGTLGIIGLLGNFLTCIIVWAKLKEKSMYVYIFMLSLCDLLYVLAALTYILPLLISRGSMDIAVITGCNIILLLNFLPAHISAWMVVCISIERAMFSARMQPGDHLSHRATHMVIIVVVACLFLLEFPFFGAVRPADPNSLWFSGGCEGVNPTMEYIFSEVYPWVEIGIYFGIPACIITICNIIIIYSVRAQRRRIDVVLKQTETGTTYARSINATSGGSSENASPPSRKSPRFRQLHVPSVHPYAVSPCQVMPLQRKEYPFRSLSSHRLTKTCLLLSIAYILLILPSYGVFIIFGAVSEEHNEWVELLLKIISFILSLTNHCINCLLYCLTGSVFRKELCKRLRKLTCKIY